MQDCAGIWVHIYPHVGMARVRRSHILKENAARCGTSLRIWSRMPPQSSGASRIKKHNAKICKATHVTPVSGVDNCKQLHSGARLDTPTVGKVCKNISRKSSCCGSKFRIISVCSQTGTMKHYETLCNFSVIPINYY